MISVTPVACSINGGASDKYIRLYSGNSGYSYDNQVFYGERSNNAITSFGFISILINTNTYYIQIFSGSESTECCSNIEGTITTGSFTSAGFALVRVNTDLLYMPIFTKD